MKIRIYLVLGIFLMASLHDNNFVRAQISTDEVPYGILNKVDLNRLEPHYVYIPETRLKQEKDPAEYPMQAGLSLPVDIIFSENATSTILPDGGILWQLKLTVPDAENLGLVFSEFSLEEGDKLFIYDETGKEYIGAFTSANNTAMGLFSTHILPTSSLIVEYYTENTSKPAPNFIIDEMIYIWSDHALKGSSSMSRSAGPCNVNINCDEGFLWQKQKRGVARILLRSGTQWFNCTGTLINITSQTNVPYFLTSDHCGPNASEADLAVWQFYFNYEFPFCNDSLSAPNNRMITGAEVKSKAPISQGTDFKLLLLSQAPPLFWKPYYNGWSRLTSSPDSGVSIHHPSGDAKKISTFANPLISTTFTGGMPLGYWKVEWSPTVSGHGITEGGSSGSPLFDANGLITGTLTGGSASCTSPTLPDFYGKFHLHWDANGNTDDRVLSTWLDPEDLNPDWLYGFDPNAATNFVIVDIFPPKSGLVSGAGYYATNETVVLTAQPADSFYFLHWKNQLDQIVSFNMEYQFNMPETEIMLSAVFTTVQSNDSLTANAFSIDVSPNPASEYLNLVFKHSSGDAQISLYTISGQKIKQLITRDTHQNALEKIDLSAVDSGIYILSVTAGNILSTHKIIVNK
jgi:hypothetical protein